jgi:gamma-glutamylcyclotransferase (GGCT)/AIG2-like uncharacterized protein YtfP
MQDEFGDADEEVRVFVYGTLKPGEENYEAYCKNHCQAQEAIVLGQLYDLPLGYPALTAGETPIYGFLLSFADSGILTVLDELEDYNPARPPHQNEYFRIKTEAFSLTGESVGWAWTYCMEPAQVQRLGGVLLPTGRWFGNRASSLVDPQLIR